MGKPVTGKYSHKPYRCTRCGHVEDHGTNHWGDIYNLRCSNCSWKNPMEPWVRMECVETMPEGYEKPAPWTPMKLGDIVKIVCLLIFLIPAVGHTEEITIRQYVQGDFSGANYLIVTDEDGNQLFKVQSFTPSIQSPNFGSFEREVKRHAPVYQIVPFEGVSTFKERRGYYGFRYEHNCRCR